MEECLTGIISVADKIKTKTFEIKWKWDYETGSTEEEIKKNDLKDTEDIQKIRNYDFIILVSGEQIKL